MPNICRGGDLLASRNSDGHPPAKITNDARPFASNIQTQTFNVPQVSVKTTLDSITITVGGVPYTYTAPAFPAFGTDIFLSAGDYDEGTGILTLTLSNNQIISIPFGTVSGLCTNLNLLDTATDSSVPATADIIYVRANGTCGRAPAPVQAVTNDLCGEIAALNNILPVPVTANTFLLPALSLTSGACFSLTLCQALGTVDTGTDAAVPDAADIIYLRPDGTCGRAPFVISISAFPGNSAQIAPAPFAGLYVPDLCTQFLALPVLISGISSSTDFLLLYNNGTNACRRVTPSVVLCDALNELNTADATVPATALVAYTRANGTCGRAVLPTTTNGITTATDSISINFTVTDSDLTGRVLVSPLIDNVVSELASGLFVPSFNTQAVTGPTITDAVVPASATVVYVRADNTVGRAVLPAVLSRLSVVDNAGVKELWFDTDAGLRQVQLI